MIAPILAAYGFATVVIVITAALSHANGDHDTNPIAYVFWPIIAANAAALHIIKQWRK